MPMPAEEGYSGKDVVLGIADWLIDPVPEEVSLHLPELDVTAAQALARPYGPWLAKEALQAVGLGLHPTELIRAGGQGVEPNPKEISATLSSMRSGIYTAIAENAELLPNELTVLRYIITGETIVGGIRQAIGNARHSRIRDQIRYKLQFLGSPLVSDDMLERLKPSLLSNQQQSVREMLEWGRSAKEIAQELGKSHPHVNNMINAINRILGTDYAHTPAG